MQAYDKAYDLRRKVEDERDWMLGCYFYEAVSVVAHNALKKKGAKPISYRKKPVLQELEEKREADRPLTEEEKAAAIDALFAKLDGMQAKFEKAHKKK